MREVKLDTLKKVFDRIIEKLEFEGVSAIKFEDDLYNKIPTHKWSIYNKPEEVVVMGSLHDDIDSLNELISYKGSICTYVDFDRSASVLRAISEIRNPVGD